MLTRTSHMTTKGTKRSGASLIGYSCDRQEQPSIRLFAGHLANWEGAGP